MILNEEQMKNLSFPDFDVENIELLIQEKKLKIFIEGAFLDSPNGGIELGKGFIFFNKWKDFFARKFDFKKDKWIKLNNYSFESLKDICEIKFHNHIVILCGFSKESGLWLEWKICGATMYAEFDDEVEDD